MLTPPGSIRAARDARLLGRQGGGQTHTRLSTDWLGRTQTPESPWSHGAWVPLSVYLSLAVQLRATLRYGSLIPKTHVS